MKPPFFFLLATNISDISLNCNSSQVDCYLSECWSENNNETALIVHLPMFVPLPVEDDTDQFPIVNIFRQKRDFGITAAIISAIAVSAAAATTAAVAMTNQVQTASTVNTIIEKTALALQTQNNYNAHIESGILLVNQRVDVLQEIEALHKMIQLSCVHALKGLCVTPIRANVTALKEQQAILSDYLKGNWTVQGEILTKQLVFQIASLNATRLDPVTLGDFTSWITRAFSWVKEWAGMAAMAALMCLAAFVCLWCFCRLKRDHNNYKAAMYQALVAMNEGEKPAAWLASLEP